jgi:hypothetical protein
MSAFPHPALSAIAFQLAGALEEYQSAFDAFLRDRTAEDACRRVGDELDRVMMLKGALPQLSVAAVELLVCHTELVHVQLGALRCTSRQRAQLVQRHRDAVEGMHDRCVRLFCRDAAPA